MKVSSYDECVPLKIILQNFLNHVETLEAKKNEGDDQYEREFQDLKLLSESLKGLPDYSCKEGEKEVNRRKNRYKDILPFDSTRVSISEFPGVPGSNYINANYIRGASGSPAYIASQGPLANTVTDFWRMVVECEVQIIIMACNEEESGKHKCENYWLEKEDEVKLSGPYTIRLLKARTVCPDFRLRTLELTYPNNESELVTRTVIQFHYCAWPDHGVPTLVRPLLDMVRLIRDCQVSETLPLLVHCSAGCGRTGTICAIDYVWGLLRAGKLNVDFSLFTLISDMRKQRIAMVQTKEQYILVHRAVRELFLDQLKMIDAHPYENLDLHGRPLITPIQKIDPNYETIFIQNQETGIESMVSEVSEQDDVCEDTDSENLPWPVVQLHATLANQSNLPKPKPHLAILPPKPILAPVPVPEVSVERNPSPEMDVNRNRTLKESSDGKESVLSIAAKSSLIRRPSILKLKALFEKSSSEPRSSSSPEKKAAKKSSIKKANSFRLREEHLKSSKEGLKIIEFKEFCHPPKLSLASEFHADLEAEMTHSGEEKPILPIKRSKSMKVYRDFDLEQRKKMVEPAEVEVITPPSFTYLSREPSSSKPRNPATDSVNSGKNLVISSLDRGRESKYVKPESKSDLVDYKESMWSGTCGSLDRVLKIEDSKESCEVPRTETKAVPIFKAESAPVKDLRPIPQYVSPISPPSSGSAPSYSNVALLKRSQATHSTSQRVPGALDDDARQVLKNCQAYLADDAPLPAKWLISEKKQSPLSSPAKVQAVSAESAPDFAQLARDAQERLAKLVGGANPAEGRQRQRRDSFKQAVWVGSSDKTFESQPSPVKTKNANDYEAIWLSGKIAMEQSRGEGGEHEEDEVDSNAPAPVAMEPVYVNLPSVKRGIQVSNAQPVSQAQLTEARNLDYSKLVNKEAIFVQKSGEISHLLSELKVTDPVTRTRDDYAKIKKHSAVLSPAAVRKPPYVNYPQPPMRTEQSSNKVPITLKSPATGKKAMSSYFYPSPIDGNVKTEVVNQKKSLAATTAAPATLYVTLPPEGGSTSNENNRKTRREPPKYQAPPDPPCKRLVVDISRPPIAPPRGVKRISSLGSLPLEGEFKGSKENGSGASTAAATGTSFSSTPVGVDIDAIAASINLNEGPKPAAEVWTGSPLANKALSKALGKFHARAQSLKTKFVQLGDALETGASSKNATDAENSGSRFERTRSEKPRQPVGFPPETVTNARKKQQYL